MIDPNADDAVATVKQAISDSLDSIRLGYRHRETLRDAIFAAIFRPEVRWAAVVVGTMPEREEA